VPKRHKLKSATPHSHANQADVVHDRRASQLPHGAVVSVVEVDDPYARGERISAVASLGDDPLGALHVRHQIDAAKFMAGRHWQRLYEASQIGTLRGMDLTRERVDGGGGNGVELMSDHRIKAMAALTRCCGLLGQEGDALVRDVLGKGMQVTEAAAARGLGPRGLVYLGQRLRECLETLAHEFGYA
jgi:hypothetical protein